MEADAAVIMATAAGSSLSCFCFAADAAAITAAANLSGLFKAEVISSAFSDGQTFVFLCALFLFSVQTLQIYLIKGIAVQNQLLLFFIQFLSLPDLLSIYYM